MGTEMRMRNRQIETGFTYPQALRKALSDEDKDVEGYTETHRR